MIFKPHFILKDFNTILLLLDLVLGRILLTPVSRMCKAAHVIHTYSSPARHINGPQACKTKRDANQLIEKPMPSDCLRTSSLMMPCPPTPLQSFHPPSRRRYRFEAHQAKQ
ncbi:hypothetical protein EJ08DRAFT_437782 [Tothia fuscella]|uniref:Uncharacterized protein n=1 Tax=Tothia fuscella TaxID=1048955 RepID=A0A9P4P1G0_9PEZI|nr:hypothetical protein EJ08DRAFT_437782 [Tothia fuscella]